MKSPEFQAALARALEQMKQSKEDNIRDVQARRLADVEMRFQNALNARMKLNQRREQVEINELEAIDKFYSDSKFKN